MPLTGFVHKLIKAHDGTLIHTALFEPETAPTGVVHLIHGFGEGVEHFESTADFFNHNAYACVAHDLRGYGKMPDKTHRQRRAARGISPDYNCYIEDLNTIRGQIDQWYPGLPSVLFGFSMGGNIIINYLLKYPQDQYEKVILVSPWLRLHRPLPGIIETIANCIGKVSRKLTVCAHLNVRHFSRDMDKMNRLKAYNIYHDRISFRLYSEISDAGEYAIKNADKITVPTLLLCAGEDKIVSPSAIREFSGNAKENVTFIEYPDGYHYLHLDIISDEVLSTILSFCTNTSQ